MRTIDPKTALDESRKANAKDERYSAMEIPLLLRYCKKLASTSILAESAILIAKALAGMPTKGYALDVLIQMLPDVVAVMPDAAESEKEKLARSISRLFDQIDEREGPAIFNAETVLDILHGQYHAIGTELIKRFYVDTGDFETIKKIHESMAWSTRSIR